MGYRISKVYTKTGDQGQTALSDNKRIFKHHPMVEMIGQIDSLNASIGVVVAFSDNKSINETLQHIQHQLFNIGGHLSYPESPSISDADIKHLEDMIDRYNDQLPPLKEFILPGGSKAASLCHQARTTARAVERYYVELMQKEIIQNKMILQYLNRLSDLLFVLARYFNYDQNHIETLWASHRVTTQQND
ncbi:cob(I)yrinic acid a,c-diamide adenosyltransferase [Fangia hongkongensis]|uniref:cob(I)yrinic acid a,c-diamide adenosyltransferase n=1 Tax=Fangia hongkongensis TaxID=270495 RepID=UPI00037A7331|nr:cob(I)yrinic acid a,c-diamide adenosyltransferase [Fangia hongkongensis]MBK2124203.1 cob(I)yrinic acid a,c-diamide adenosyltransferase [Fangia hongkongensis]